jgi:hypothetical protein
VSEQRQGYFEGFLPIQARAVRMQASRRSTMVWIVSVMATAARPPATV